MSLCRMGAENGKIYCCSESSVRGPRFLQRKPKRYRVERPRAAFVFLRTFGTPAGVTNDCKIIKLLGACGITGQLPTHEQKNLTDPPLYTPAQIPSVWGLPSMSLRWSNHGPTFLHAHDLYLVRRRYRKVKPEAVLYRINRGLSL